MSETGAPARNSTPAADARYEEIRKGRELELQRLTNSKITFFGRVVDEQNNPVAGAQTIYTVHNLDLRGNPPVRGPVADSDGRFEIRTQGPSISVKVQHPDYYQAPRAELTFEYASIQGTGGPLPTLGSPAQFILQKKGIAPDIIHHARLEARLPPNGSPVALDLRKGVHAHSPEAIVLSLIAQKGNLTPNEFHPFDWILRLEVRGGGLSERTNPLDFVPPETGYQSSITISMPVAGEKHWSSEIEKRFFVLFPTTRYARINLRLHADTGLCVVESFLNPTPGSRNLEFDPAKQIKAKK